MESASIPAPDGEVSRQAPRAGEKGLKTGALGYISNLVIGVASTAPGYSLAATLGFITAIVAFHAPAIMLISFVPMLLIAAAYYYMNKADPDCGTSFTWVAKAFGKQGADSPMPVGPGGARTARRIGLMVEKVSNNVPAGTGNNCVPMPTAVRYSCISNW